jgi:hypothetical protein
MTNEELIEIGNRLKEHLGGTDYVIAAIGAHGPNLDMPDGNVLATVRMGNDEETVEAKYLTDAVAIARARIIRKRDAAKKAKAKAKGETP